MSNPVSTSRPRSRATPTRAQDPEGTRQNIIEVAAQEFALNGLSGARIDESAPMKAPMGVRVADTM